MRVSLIAAEIHTSKHDYSCAALLFIPSSLYWVHRIFNVQVLRWKSRVAKIPIDAGKSEGSGGRHLILRHVYIGGKVRICRCWHKLWHCYIKSIYTLYTHYSPPTSRELKHVPMKIVNIYSFQIRYGQGATPGKFVNLCEVHIVSKLLQNIIRLANLALFDNHVAISAPLR